MLNLLCKQKQGKKKIKIQTNYISGITLNPQWMGDLFIYFVAHKFGR